MSTQRTWPEREAPAEPAAGSAESPYFGRAARGVAGRVFVSGILLLETPAHFGNGDVAGLTDLPLARDPADGRTPLLTGASLAGALRNYLREVEHGYGAQGAAGDLAHRLFGWVREWGEGASYPSWLLIDDALGSRLGAELRDGVAIDPATRTAEAKKKYDIELLPAGTTFPLAFELLLPEPEQEAAALLEALTVALAGLEVGEIGLGQRKRRGLGRCRVTEWEVRHYPMTTAAGLLGWLVDERSNAFTSTARLASDGQSWQGRLHGKEEAIAGPAIGRLLEVTPALADGRRTFTIAATFQLTSSLLIRSSAGAADSPDMIHLHSRRRGQVRPILSGTSLAGAVRARALRIANTVLGRPAGSLLVDGLFGRRIRGRQDEPSGSRVVVQESELTGTADLVQSRVKLDRFTGGSFPTALFTEQPAFGGDGASVAVRLELRQRRPPQGESERARAAAADLTQANNAEIGLLLLVLKDLWTGDLPLGGESSVGRGRLQGKEAVLTLRDGAVAREWRLRQDGDRLAFEGDAGMDELEGYVRALWAYRASEGGRGRAA